MRPASITIMTAAAMALSFAVGLVLPRLPYHPDAATPPTSSACAPPFRAMTRLELLFGAAKPDGTEVSDADWLAFLDETVTPRFPDGLTVLDGRGQWRNARGEIVREATRVLLVWHLPHARTAADIAAIRETYKQRFGQESVMRIDGVGCVAF